MKYCYIIFDNDFLIILGVDIDIVCIVFRYVDRLDFFLFFFEILKNILEVKDLRVSVIFCVYC